MTSKKSIIIYSISIVLLIASLAMVIFLSLKKINRYDPDTVDPSGNVITYDDYNDGNKEVFVTCMSALLGLGADTYSYSDKWKENLVSESLTNLVDSIEEVGIDMEVFYNLSRYIYLLPDKLAAIDLNTDTIDSNTLSLGDIVNLLAEVDNLDAIVKLFEEIYDTGLTDDDIAEITWCFVNRELKTLKSYSTYLTLELNADIDSDVAILFEGFKLLLIDLIPNIDQSISGMGKDQFIEQVKSTLDSVHAVITDLRGFRVFKLSKLMNSLATGVISAKDFKNYFLSVKQTLEDMMIDNSNNKFFDFTSFTQPALSVTLKIAVAPHLMRYILNNVEHDKAAEDAVDISAQLINGFNSIALEIAKIAVSLEDMLNLLFNGIYNLSEFVAGEGQVITRDDQGNIVAKQDVSEAIANNIRDIYDGNKYVVNNDTIILLSKLVSYFLSENGLNTELLREFSNSVVNPLTYAMALFGLYMNINSEPEEGRELDEVITVDNGIPDALTEFSNIFIEKLSLIADVCNQYALLDLGATDDDLAEISGSTGLYKDAVNNIINLIANGDFVTAQDVGTWVFTYLLMKWSIKYFVSLNDDPDINLFAILTGDDVAFWHFVESGGSNIDWKMRGRTIIGAYGAAALVGLSATAFGLTNISILFNMLQVYFGMDAEELVDVFKADEHGLISSFFGNSLYDIMLLTLNKYEENINTISGTVATYDKIMDLITWPATAMLQKFLFTDWNIAVDVPEYITNIFKTR